MVIFIRKISNKSKVLFIRLLDKYFPFVNTTYARNFTSSIMKDISSSAYIVSPVETLRTIEEQIKQRQRGAYMRFGDGDIFLVIGKKDAYQSVGEKLCKEMNQSFSLKGP